MSERGVIGARRVVADRPNPYVGPRSMRYGEPIFGRRREIDELRGTLLSHRIVLLYSPSGAGKTSLLEAGLRRELERREFRLFPPVRVGYEVPGAFSGLSIENRYLLSTLVCLEEGRPPEARLAPDELAHIPLNDYLARLRDEHHDDLDPCLFFDQFEELFTLDPTDHVDKSTFLTGLGVALRDRGLWALFSMREDFLAQLDPYLTLIPTRFACRYRLDLLGTEAAKSAVQQPSAAAGIDFTDAAVDALVNDLRRVRVRRGALTRDELGPYVEPVQLQVVCHQVWRTLADGATSIKPDDIGALGNVDNALADFYVEEIRDVATRTRTSEREIRAWFEDRLISEDGFRTQVLEGPGASGGAVLRELENAHLIRAERRRGTEWYELCHDRLVEPIRTSNAAWREQHLTTLQREAQIWDRRGRPAGLLLLSGDLLTEARAWAASNPDELLPVDRTYLEACEAGQRRLEQERRAARRTRTRAALATTIGAVSVIGLVVVGWLLIRTSRAERDAQEAETRARTAAAAEIVQRRLADASFFASEADRLMDDQTDLGLLLALESLALRDTPSGNQSLAEGVTRGTIALTPLGGHGAMVTDVSFNVDASMLAAATTNGTVRLWNPMDGTLVRELESVGESVLSVAFHPTDPAVLATGSSDGTLRLWDANTGRLLRSPLWLAEFGGLRSIAFAPHGTTVAVATDTGVVIVDADSWTVRDGLETSGIVWDLAFTPDGLRLASAGGDAMIRLWDVATAQAMGGPLQGHTDVVRGVRFSSDGQTLASASEDGTVRLWTTDGQPLAMLDDPNGCPTGSCLRNEWLLSLAFSRDDSQLAAAAADGVVRVWDTRDLDRPPRHLSGHSGLVNRVAFSRDGMLLASAGEDETVRLWRDVKPGILEEAQDQPTKHLMALAFHPEGGLVATGGFDGRIRVHDAVSGALVMGPMEHGSQVLALDISPDGQLLASAGLGGVVKLWPLNGSTEHTELTLSEDRDVFALDFSSNGWLAAGVGQIAALVDPELEGGQGYVQLWDVAGGQRIRRLAAGETVLDVEFSPDGTTLASGAAGPWESGEGKHVLLHDPATGRPLRELRGHSGAWVLDVAFNRDGTLLASAGSDATIRLWNPESGRQTALLAGHADWVRGLSFDRDGLLLASTGGDNSVRIWDTRAGRQLGEPLETPTGPAQAVAFSPDGTRLMAAGGDGRAEIGNRTVELDEGTSGATYVWAGPAQWRHQACELAGRNLTVDEWDFYIGRDVPYQETC